MRQQHARARRGRTLALASAALVAGLVIGSVGVSYAATDEPASPLTGAGMRMGQAIRDAGARMVDIVAGLTGLSADEVKAERAEGRSIAEIAEANGVEAQAVVDAALAARATVLDAKVADGTITQEQADAAYARMSERIAERVNRTETARPSWVGGRRDGTGRGATGSGCRGGQGSCAGVCTATD